MIALANHNAVPSQFYRFAHMQEQIFACNDFDAAVRAPTLRCRAVVEFKTISEILSDLIK